MPYEEVYYQRLEEESPEDYKKLKSEKQDQSLSESSEF